MSTSFLGSNNTNILYMDYGTANIAIGAYNPAAKLDVAGDTIIRSNVTVNGVASLCNNTNVFGEFAASNTAIFYSNVSILGQLSVSNVTYVTSNVTIYSSELIQSNLNVTNNLYVDGTIGVSNIATFTSNISVQGASEFLGDATFSNQVDLLNDLKVYGTATLCNFSLIGSANFSNSVAILSNLDVTGPITFSNTLGVSDVATFDSNIFITGAVVATGSATFSNPVQMLSNVTIGNVLNVTDVNILGRTTMSNYGVVTFDTSNNQLGFNLGGSNPRADLDISNGNILSKNFRNISKYLDSSNDIDITVNWDNAYADNNQYLILLDLAQTINNGSNAGFRQQMVAIGVSNQTVQHLRSASVFGDNDAYTTLSVSKASSTTKSITLRSSTNWATSGTLFHAFTVNVIQFPETSNLGNLYLN